MDWLWLEANISFLQMLSDRKADWTLRLEMPSAAFWGIAIIGGFPNYNAKVLLWSSEAD